MTSSFDPFNPSGNLDITPSPLSASVIDCSLWVGSSFASGCAVARVRRSSSFSIVISSSLLPSEAEKYLQCRHDGAADGHVRIQASTHQCRALVVECGTA